MAPTADRPRRWTPLLVLGVLVTLYGGTVAALIGPDDSVQVGEHTVPSDARGLAVVTHPEVTSFTGLDLQVEASAPSGVFLASSHRVDTTNLLEGRGRYEITRVMWRDVGGYLRPDGREATFSWLRPDRIVGWHRTAPTMPAPGALTGEDELPTSAELVVALDGTPVDVVAFPRAGDEVVTLSVGAHVAHVFALHLALVGFGAVFIAAWWVLRRLSRRGVRFRLPRRRGPDGPGSGDSSGGGSGSGTGAEDAAGDGSRTHGLPQHPSPHAAPASPQGSTSRLPGLCDRGADPSPATVPGLVRTTTPTTRSTQATRATPTTRATGSSSLAPTGRLPHVVTLPILGVLLLGLVLSGCAVPTAVPQTTRTTEKVALTPTEAAQATGLEVGRVYAPSFTGYPMWAAVEIPPESAGGRSRLRVMTRSAFAVGWSTVGTVRITGELPDPGVSTSRTSRLVQRTAESAADDVSRFWMTGKAGDLEVARPARRVRTRFFAGQRDPARTWVLGDGTQTARVVAVGDGHLALLRHTMQSGGAFEITSAVLLRRGGPAEVLGSTPTPVA